MDSLSPKYVLPAPDIVWRPRIEAGIGIYIAGREARFAAPGSPDEAALQASGALRFGTVRFNRDPAERSHPRRRVQPLPAVDAAERFGREGDRN